MAIYVAPKFKCGDLVATVYDQRILREWFLIDSIIVEHKEDLNRREAPAVVTVSYGLSSVQPNSRRRLSPEQETFSIEDINNLREELLELLGNMPDYLGKMNPGVVGTLRNRLEDTAYMIEAHLAYIVRNANSEGDMHA